MPVSLKELKEHLRIEHEDEDGYLELMLKMAQATAEDFCKQEFSVAPEPVRLAILLHASHYYVSREAASREAYDSMMRAFQALLWPYRNTDKLI